MNQEIYSYFVDLINDNEAEMFKSNFFSQESIQERLNEFTDENGKMDMYKATAYFSRETEHKIAIMMARVLTSLVENDLIKNPLQDD